MAQFPTVQALAAADIDAVLHLWTGLGYYARARNLHRAAQQICSEFDGQFPDSLDTILTLPGIGRSTAGAILSIAFQKAEPILDGNVKRVLTRVHAIEGWPGQRSVHDALWALAEHHTPIERVADYTQAIMDLGATLCTRTRPNCSRCPLKSDCQAHHLGSPERFPGKKPKKDKPIKATRFAILCLDRHSVYLERRPSQGIWGGLYCFPQFNLEEDPLSELTQQHSLSPHSVESLDHFRHTFSHFHLDIHPLIIHTKTAPKLAGADGIWYKLGQANPFGLAAPVKRILDQLEQTVDSTQ